MNRKTVIILAVVILLLAFLVFVSIILLDRAEQKENAREIFEYFTPAPRPPTPKSEKAAEETEESEDEPYVSPVDFEGLWQENPDIYAWIDIPGTEISHPVLNRPGDNAFYMEHNTFAEDDGNGALFTEDYNTRNFTDPVTVIYGHRSGLLFNVLPGSYSSEELLRENGTINIYLPECEYSYKVFAAVPYSNVHILYTYDFSRKVVYDAFFKDVLSTRSLDAVKLEDEMPEFGDRVIILSTCVGGDRSRRFLVLAKMSDS